MRSFILKDLMFIIFLLGIFFWYMDFSFANVFLWIGIPAVSLNILSIIYKEFFTLEGEKRRKDDKLKKEFLIKKWEKEIKNNKNLHLEHGKLWEFDRVFVEKNTLGNSIPGVTVWKVKGHPIPGEREDITTLEEIKDEELIKIMKKEKL